MSAVVADSSFAEKKLSESEETPLLLLPSSSSRSERTQKEESSQLGSLTPSEIQSYYEQGYVLLTNVMTRHETAQMQEWSTEMSEEWIPNQERRSTIQDGGGWTMHHERIIQPSSSPSTSTSALRSLCRIENFIPFHSKFEDLVRMRITPLVSQLFDEPACLFKEKLNYKGAGGNGYAPHYDGVSAAALQLATTFITAQVAIDDQTIENGCLFGCFPKRICPPEPICVAADAGGDPDITGRAGAIPADIASTMQWSPMPAPAGSVLLFNHFFPHRSPPNRSDSTRRTGYFIYNAESEGDHHELYYYMMAEARLKFAMKAAEE